MSLESFRRKTGTILRTAVAAVPGLGGPIANYLTEQSLDLLRADLEKWFAEVGARLEELESAGELDRDGLDTGFQRFRLSTFASRAMASESEVWRHTLALAYAKNNALARPSMEIRAELDRIVLSLEPHDVILLQHLRCTCTPAPKDRPESADKRITAHYDVLSGELGWTPALLEASAGRILALLLARDEGIGRFDYRPGLGHPTTLGLSLLQHLEVAAT
jgi:hypothetical protein